MKQISLMIKPASSMCNLRCKYCFYTDVSHLREVGSRGIMSPETAERVMENVFQGLAAGDHADIVFQGGEPTLAGLGFFRRFVRRAADVGGGVSVSYALQTNGILLDDEWAGFLSEHGFLVGLSLDGAAEYHNAARVDTEGEGTFKQVMRAKNVLERHGVSYNVLTVLTRQISRHPQAVWNFLQRNNISYVQFIPCLEPMHPARRNPFALEPEGFASFYTALFAMWYAELKQGRYTSVKLFDDIVNQLAFGMLTACGQDGRCRPQVVVEADGSVYPCDFYALDGFCMGSLGAQPLEELFRSTRAELFRRDMQTASPVCERCRYRNLCGGGCKRMRRTVYGGADGQTCGYQMLLDRCFDAFCQIARMQQRLRRG